MRLWHYKLLKVLPDTFIVADWRECLAIKRQWEKGTLKHRLVNYVLNYNRRYFLNYVHVVVFEMQKRGIKFQEKLYEEIKEFCLEDKIITGIWRYPEHNTRYLIECLYNLEEKAMRGIISKKEWLKIYDKFENIADLWEG